MDFGSAETWRFIWLALAVVLAIGEIAVAGTFFLLPFAAGAGLAAVTAFAGLSPAASGAVFVAASTASFALMFPLRRRLDSQGHAAVGAHRWVGKEAHVLEEIPGGAGSTGLIRLDREQWRAESLTGAPIRAGSTVLISRVAGTRLVVLPIDEPPMELEEERNPS